MLTNADLTIFNRYIENRETKYQKSHIYDVHWEDNQGANILQSGLVSADRSTIYIPFDSCKDYVTPSEFKINHNGKITFQPEDVIVKGIIDDEFTTIKDFEKKYDFVRMVTTVDTRDYGSQRMRHWEVGAK